MHHERRVRNHISEAHDDNRIDNKTGRIDDADALFVSPVSGGVGGVLPDGDDVTGIGGLVPGKHGAALKPELVDCSVPTHMNITQSKASIGLTTGFAFDAHGGNELTHLDGIFVLESPTVLGIALFARKRKAALW